MYSLFFVVLFNALCSIVGVSDRALKADLLLKNDLIVIRNSVVHYVQQKCLHIRLLKETTQSFRCGISRSFRECSQSSLRGGTTKQSYDAMKARSIKIASRQRIRPIASVRNDGVEDVVPNTASRSWLRKVLRMISSVGANGAMQSTIHSLRFNVACEALTYFNRMCKHDPMESKILSDTVLDTFAKTKGSCPPGIKGSEEKTIRSKILSIASAELGVREATGKNDGERVEEYLAYTNLGKGHEWCAAFVSWCYGQARLSQPRNPWSPALFPKARTYWKQGQFVSNSKIASLHRTRPIASVRNDGIEDVVPNTASRPWLRKALRMISNVGVYEAMQSTIHSLRFNVACEGNCLLRSTELRPWLRKALRMGDQFSLNNQNCLNAVSFLVVENLASIQPSSLALVLWSFLTKEKGLGPSGHEDKKIASHHRTRPNASVRNDGEIIHSADIFGIYGRTAKRINHVGLVKKIEGKYLVSIEGNSSNKVESRRRHLSTVYAVADWIKK